MAAFLIDEDLPRTLALDLRSAGHEAVDVRDVGLAGQPDSAVYRWAQDRDLVLISADLEFGNLLLFPLGSHHGVVLIRIPEDVSAPRLKARVVEFVRSVPQDGWCGTLFVLEVDRVRVRRS